MGNFAKESGTRPESSYTRGRAPNQEQFGFCLILRKRSIPVSGRPGGKEPGRESG